MILLLKVCKVNRFIHKIFSGFCFALGILTKTEKEIEEILIFLDHMNFQKIEINFFYKIILVKAGFAVPFKFGDGGFQPDGLSQIELQADFLQGVKYLMGAGLLPSVLNNGILYHPIIFKFLCP